MKHELSKKRLEEIAADGFVAHGEIKAMARALLAAHEHEPYGYVHKAIYETVGSCGLSSDHAAYRNTNGDHIPLYTHPAPSGTNQVDELVMLVKRLAHSLEKANPDSKLHLDAMDYLKRNALIGITDLLRVSHPAPSIPAAVPEEMPTSQNEDGFDIDYMAPREVYDLGKTDGWNACRASMLNGGKL